MPYCPNCGNPVNAGDRFCANCGTAIQTVTMPVTNTVNTINNARRDRKSVV